MYWGSDKVGGVCAGKAAYCFSVSPNRKKVLGSKLSVGWGRSMWSVHFLCVGFHPLPKDWVQLVSSYCANVRVKRVCLKVKVISIF